MRVLFAALLVALPALAAAQSARSVGDPDTPLPSIGLPLPQIGLPLAPIGLPQADTPTNRGDRRSPPSQRQHRGSEKRERPSKRSVVYVIPAYGWNAPPVAPTGGSVPAEPAPSSQPEEPSPPTGTLSLDVPVHAGAQLYVDDFYVGTTDEIGRELTLEAGPHRVEMRAPGYETLGVNVRIEPGRVITYRGTPQPLAATATPAPAPRAVDANPAQRKPFYVIPGCYLGNVPPKDAGLPATCDQSKAITIWP